jgi:hypothetical protein
MSGFGWSVSDLALGIKFVVKIGQALKETGGASEDYQESVEFLRCLELTLRNLERLAPLLPGATSAEAIFAQAKRIQLSIDACRERVEKFENSLGPNRKKGIWHGFTCKVEWVVFVAQKAKDLQRDVTLPMSTINTNLAILGM